MLGMLAPHAAGGLGLSEVDQVLILEETGRVALPGPIVEHAAVAVPLLAASGSTAMAGPAVAGDAVVSFAARPDRIGWAADCDAFIVVDGRDAVLVAAEQVTRAERLPVVDRSRRDCRAEWSAGHILPAADVALALDRAALGAAAQLCGLASQLIDMTVEYTKTRRQFGVPIGSYQAVKHHLANAALRLEHARPAVYRAAYSVAHDLGSRARDVSTAKVLAGAAGSLAGRVALQCHGAIGYTWEADVHLWMKRVWVLERSWGDSAAHRERVADAVIGPAPPAPW